MSLNYYADFSVFLKLSREKAGIGLDKVSSLTRIPFVYLNSIEQGEFDFASSVLIQGYLRQYARIIGINEDAVARQYNLILRKIAYVSSDHHLPPPFIEQPHDPVAQQIKDSFRRSRKWIRQHTIPGHADTGDDSGDLGTEQAGWEITSDPLIKTGKAIDEEVAKKWLAERRLTNWITAFCICLLGLSFVFFFSEPAGSGSQKTFTDDNKDSESLNAVSQDNKRLSVTTKTKWDLTPALLTEEEISEKERVKKWLIQDSMQIRKNLFNRAFPEDQLLKPVSIHESALFLESNY